MDSKEIEVSQSEWLAEWNLEPAKRHSGRPCCSVHWVEGAARELLPADKVFRRETQSQYQKSLFYLLKRDGQIVAVSEQVLWKIIE